VSRKRWNGVYPAVVVPFEEGYSIDERSFRNLLRWLVGHEGVAGVVMYQRGLIANPIARPPVTPLSAVEKEGIREGLELCDLLPVLSPL